MIWLYIYLLLIILDNKCVHILGSNVNDSSIDSRSGSTANNIPIISAGQTAYVGIYYEQNNYYDNIMLTGLRTMMKTVSESGTTRDRIVLILPHTKQSTRDILLADGLQLVEASPTLYNNAQNKCWYEFRVIDLFQLVQYKRIVYLDSDHLVVNNMDELFLCGEYCMQYNSLIHFTDTVFVIKPNMIKYDMLIQKFHSLSYNQHPPKFCIDEASVFWILAFGDIEAGV